MTKKNAVKYDPEQLAARLREMPEGVYELTADVRNPCCDKRKLWGTGLDAAPEVLPKGEKWVLRHYEGSREVDLWTEISFRCQTSRNASTEIRFFLRKDGKAEARPAASAEDGPGLGVHLAVLDALKAAPRNLDTVRMMARVRSGGSRAGWGALEVLHKAGKVSLDDIEAAAAAWINEEPEED